MPDLVWKFGLIILINVWKLKTISYVASYASTWLQDSPDDPLNAHALKKKTKKADDFKQAK